MQKSIEAFLGGHIYAIHDRNMNFYADPFHASTDDIAKEITRSFFQERGKNLPLEKFALMKIAKWNGLVGSTESIAHERIAEITTILNQQVGKA